jgi:hypothetical protein
MNTQNLEVFTRIDNFNERFVIISKNDIQNCRYCETYDNNGIAVGCYSAQCYTFGDGTFDNDIAREIKNNFEIDVDMIGVSDIDDFLSIFDENPEYDDIEKFVREWVSKNEHHTECESIEYWDGRNNRSVVVAHEYCSIEECSNLKNVDAETKKSVLNEMPDYIPHIEKTHETIETESWKYTYSRMADFPWICSVR